MQHSPKKRQGFTIVELLVVIAIMAVIITLATGAVVKSVKQGRRKRIDITVAVLQAALENYRALRGEWPGGPFTSPDSASDDDKKKASYAEKKTFENEANQQVFKHLFDRTSGVSLDSSAVMTRTSSGRMTAREALEKGQTSFPLGYPDADNPDKFKFFRVIYYFSTDSMAVKKIEGD
jgi:prepilin-type N-terminal cleavage/methylation domain-containing protein